MRIQLSGLGLIFHLYSEERVTPSLCQPMLLRVSVVGAPEGEGELESKGAFGLGPFSL